MNPGPEPSGQLPPAIPDHDLVRELGRGSFGTVWLARSRTGVHHAVKVVPKSRLAALERELHGVRAFEVQARGHPGLVGIRHVGETDDALYCVMELADGYGTAPTFSPDDYEPRTLQAEIDRKGALTLAEIEPIVRSVLGGLGHLHGQGLLHRDVKPANILFVEGRAKLADVGLVTSRARREDRAGSPAYMPPETVVDASGDLYSLGITLFCAVTGAPPVGFPELPAAIAPERLAAFRRIAPVLDRACAPAREDRFADAREFEHAFDVALGVAAGPARRGRRRALAAAGVVAAAALGFAAWRAVSAGEVRARAGPALTGHLEVRFRDPVDATIVRAVSEASPVVPLRTEDEVSVHAEFSEPVFPVLVYLDDNGAARVLYPSSATEAGTSCDTLSTGTFRLEDPPGTLTFVLFAAREPVADHAGLARLVAEHGGAPRCPPNVLLHVGADGMARSVAARADVNRSPSPGLGRAVVGGPLASPVHGSLDRLRAEFGARFELVRALAVPQIGSGK